MINFFKSIKRHPKTLISILIILTLIYIMLKLNWDIRAIAIIALIISYISNVFMGISAIIGTIPIIGPIVVNIFSIPIFWILNLTGYFTSAIAIKKGYKKEILTHRLITIVLLIGLVLGYIIGNLIPVP